MGRAMAYEEKADGGRLIECFVEKGHDFQMRPAPVKRRWMDESPQQFAYRCLPLNIANSHGWEILNPCRFVATWTGGDKIDDLVVMDQEDRQSWAMSHFGCGILTFTIPCLFRTPRGIDLWITGPANDFKTFIQPLSALIETDWPSSSFTMNWKFTSPGSTIAFERGESIAQIFPVPRGLIETFEPVLRRPEDDPELWEAKQQWGHDRRDFNEGLKQPGSQARQRGWQRDYFNGPADKLDPPHRTKIKLKPLRALDE